MQINRKYGTAFFILLVTEMIIAFFVKDAFVRPYIGDILVVILMYTFIRGATKKSMKGLPIYLFLFASAVEFAQYYHIVDRLNLQNNKVISIILGTSFDVKDLLCYFTAAVLLMVWERIEKQGFRHG